MTASSRLKKETHDNNLQTGHEDKVSNNKVGTGRSAKVNTSINQVVMLSKSTRKVYFN